MVQFFILINISSFNNVVSQSSNAKEDIKDLKKNVDNVKEDIEDLKKNVDNVTNSVSNVKEDIDDLKKNVDNVTNSVSNVKEDMMELKENLKGDMKELKEDMVQVVQVLKHITSVKEDKVGWEQSSINRNSNSTQCLSDEIGSHQFQVEIFLSRGIFM